MNLKKLFFKMLKKSPANMEMVKYWKYGHAVQAKVLRRDGVLMMQMEGEKYPFPGFPRGYILYGKLSKLKHEIKNQIFNDSWKKLEDGVSEKQVAKDIKEIVFPKIFSLLEESRMDIVPPESMCKPVRELYRAWSKVAPGKKSSLVRDTLCYILQEDDGYRFRVQWLVTYFNPSSWWFKILFKNPVNSLSFALSKMEQAEIIDDMKERERLWKRIIMGCLKDEQIKEKFIALCKEMDWNKFKLSKADKYFFRAKYFKVDLDKFDY